MNEAVPPRVASYYLGALLLVKDRAAAWSHTARGPADADHPY